MLRNKQQLLKKKEINHRNRTILWAPGVASHGVAFYVTVSAAPWPMAEFAVNTQERYIITKKF